MFCRQRFTDMHSFLSYIFGHRAAPPPTPHCLAPRHRRRFQFQPHPPHRLYAATAAPWTRRHRYACLTSIDRIHHHQTKPYPTNTSPHTNTASSLASPPRHPPPALRHLDARTGARLGSFEGHSALVTGLAWLPPGRQRSLFLSAGQDRRLLLWEVQPFTPTPVPQGTDSPNVGGGGGRLLCEWRVGNQLASTRITGLAVVPSPPPPS